MINSEEVKPIADWEKLYPEVWLFIEVTREDMWEVYEGKLIATADDPMEFLDLDKDYNERGVVTLTTKGVSISESPTVIPTFAVLNQ